MLTIKHKALTGDETVFDYGTRSVKFDANAVRPEGQEARPKLMVESKDGEVIDWTMPGSWYVMNDSGKTVATYWIPPIEEARQVAS
jgi:hypothetical protein